MEIIFETEDYGQGHEDSGGFQQPVTGEQLGAMPHHRAHQKVQATEAAAHNPLSIVGAVAMDSKPPTEPAPADEDRV